MSNYSSKSTIARLLYFFSRRSLTFARLFAHFLASLINILHLTKTSKTIRLNLQIALPELTKKQREKITRTAIKNEIMSYMEFFHIWGSTTTENIESIHKVYGEALLHRALAEKKGVVLIVPHFGTWEIMNAWVAQYTQMTIMYKPIKHPIADQFVRDSRSREKAHLVPTDETGIRQIFKALKQGGTTVILPDHTPDHPTEMVSYFDIPLYSSNLSSKLIQKTKAKALFLYALRNEAQGFDIHFEEIDPLIYQLDPDQGTEIIYQSLETLIHKYPEHYHWSYKRFSANPALKRIYDIPSTEALEKIQGIRRRYKNNK
ncbi:lipid A biosynthesis acyltransferase [Acinetobacter sp. ANC 4558]|uniref:lysophospholipid acyltransferase family protein n=1 Tax=Acinetobacter sp. ANC 4558 TaxID=1977876 RepID=UPI000A349821|nr:lipid A biosynthesis acyltransferase [Acinetobacter sp. ANC 4558]OTG87621.1 lipid A biosynthesis acyltransferase [Acinetobacter sp. ANC 4558]